MKAGIKRRCDRGAYRKIAAIMAGALVLFSVLQYWPLISQADSGITNNVLQGLHAERQENDVKLSWGYGNVQNPDYAEYIVTGYEVLLTKTTDKSSVTLWTGMQMEEAVNSFTVMDSRKTAETYTVEVYANYEVTIMPSPIPETDKPPQPPAEEPTRNPVEEPTEPPAEEATQNPVEEPTQPPAEEPTEPPAEEPTQNPAEEATQKPAEEPTQPPAEEPTPGPAEEATQPPLTPVVIRERKLIGSSSVTWQPEYKIILNIGQNGAVEMGEGLYGGQSVTLFLKQGEQKVFTVRPDSHYEKTEIRLPAGVSVNGSEYRIAGILEDITLDINFRKILEAPKLKDSQLSQNKDNPQPLYEGTQVQFQMPEEGIIWYQMAEDSKEPAEDGWLVYDSQPFELMDCYCKGVLYAKTVPATGTDSKESSIVKWYYSTLPEMPDKDVSFLLNTEGSKGNYALSRDNWITESEDITIEMKGARAPAISTNWENILYLRMEKTGEVKKITGIKTASGTYMFNLPQDLSNGTYQIGYGAKNRWGFFTKAVYTDNYLAYEDTPPALDWRLKEGNLVKKDGAENESYYTNSALTFELDATQITLLSGIKELSYRVGIGDWKTLEASEKEVTIFPEELLKDTAVTFRAEAGNGLTKESTLYVTKDVTAPGGDDGTTAGETAVILADNGFANKNPLDSSVVAVDTSEKNTIYYHPGNGESAYILLDAVEEREKASGSIIYVKYKVQAYGTVWLADGGKELAREEDNTCKFLLSEAAELQKEGKYEIYFWTEDEAGNCSSPVSRTVCYDNSRPVVTQVTVMSDTLQPGGFQYGQDRFHYFGKNSLNLQFSILENVSGIHRVECYNVAGGTEKLLSSVVFDGNRQDGSVNNLLSIQNDGRYIICIKVYDMAGNSTSVTWNESSFILDKTPPVVTVAGLEEGVWSNQDIMLQVMAEDLETGMRAVECSLNGEPFAVQVLGNESSISFQVPVTEEAVSREGYPFTVNVHNNAGESAAGTWTVFLDKTAPEITLSQIAPQQLYQGVAELSVSIEENIYDLAEAQVTAVRKLDGTSVSCETGKFIFADTVSTQKYSFSEDGEYTVQVNAQDAAGNAADMKTVSFTIDSTAPVIRLDGITEGEYYKEDVLLNVLVEESFYESAQVQLKVTRQINGETSEYILPSMTLNAKESRELYRFSEEGTYLIEATAQDAAGNEAEAKSVSFVLDKTAPQVSIEGFTDHLVTGSSVTAKLSASDDYYQGLETEVRIIKEDVEGNRQERSLDMGSVAAGGAETETEFAEDGKYTIYLSATDRAGNTAGVEKSFIIDTQPPVIRFMEEYDGKYFISFSLKHSIEEMLLDFTLSDYKMTLNGLYYDGAGEVTEEGKYLLEITAQDEVGHETHAKAEFIVDSTPPVIVFGGVEDGTVSYEEIELSITLKEEQDIITDIKVNNITQQLSEGALQTLQFLEYGKYDVAVFSQDYAGNQENAVITVIYKEKTLFTKWLENKPLFYTTTATTAAMGVTATAAGLIKRKKIIGKGHK